MKKRSTTLLAAALVVLSVGWLSFGCGGSSGGGGPTSPPPPTVPPSGIRFTPSSSASANSIYLSAGSGGSGSVFVLDVKAQNVADVYGVSFLLDYPENQLSFRRNSESEGSFMSDGGTVDTDLQVTLQGPGELVVGISRLGTEPGASGSGTLLSLEFSKGNPGTGPIDMTDHDAIDSTGIVQLDVTWIGGTVTVN